MWVKGSWTAPVLSGSRKALPPWLRPEAPLVHGGGGVALGGPSNLSHCEFRGQRGIPGREGGGRVCGRLLAWPLLGPPCSPGSGPGAMNSDSGPCPSVSTRAATNTHTSTPGLLPATALPTPPSGSSCPTPDSCGILNTRCGIGPTGNWIQTSRNTASWN